MLSLAPSRRSCGRYAAAAVALRPPDGRPCGRRCALCRFARSRAFCGMLAIASPFGGLRRALRARRSPSGPLARPSPSLRGLGRRPAGRAGLLPCRLAASGVPAFGGALRARWRLPPRSPSAFPPCAPLRRARRPSGLLRGFASRARLAPAGSSPPRLLAASRLAGCLGAGV